jgi:hypothetical protein
LAKSFAIEILIVNDTIAMPTASPATLEKCEAGGNAGGGILCLYNNNNNNKTRASHAFIM